MTDKCSICRFRVVYTSTKKHYEPLQICNAEGWEYESDGAYKLLEISEFDSNECLYFEKEK